MSKTKLILVLFFLIDPLASTTHAQEMKLTVEHLTLKQVKPQTETVRLPAIDSAIAQNSLINPTSNPSSPVASTPLFQDRAELDKLKKSAKVEKHDLLSAIVQLDQAFELSKVEGPRTFQANGTVSKRAGGKYLISLSVGQREERADIILSNGRPAVRSRTTNTDCELLPKKEFVLGGLVSEHKQAENKATETLYEFYIVRLDEVE